MANRHFREKSAEEAWNRVNEIFPTDYAKDEDSSQRAGYRFSEAPLTVIFTITFAT